MPIVTIPAAGQYGLIADQPAQELPVNAWSDARNMRFRDGSVERFDGDKGIFAAPTITPYFIAPYGTTTKRFWIHAGLAQVHADDGTTRTDITGTAPTGGIDDRWTGGTLNGVFFLNNGKDVPQFWGGDTGLNLASLPLWDATWRAKSLGAFKVYLVALGISKGAANYPHMVKWSSAADPGTMPAKWDETDATIDAGEIDLAETPDLLVDQLVLGDVNIIYKEASMYSMQYVGGDAIFAFKRLPGNYGMLTRGCAANTPKGHVVLANGDLILHQGGEPQSLLTGRLKKWLFSTQIDSVNYKRCFVVANPTKNEVWICYPELGESSCTKALVWNWTDNSFGDRDLSGVNHAACGLLDYTDGGTWAAGTGTWDSKTTAWNQNEYTPADSRLILAMDAPLISLADIGAELGGSAISASLERTGIAFDDPSRVKTIRAVIPRVKAVKGTVLYIQVGGTMDAEVAPTWSAPVQYIVGTSYKADTFSPASRFLALRIYSDGAQGWSIKSIDVDLVMGGLY